MRELVLPGEEDKGVDRAAGGWQQRSSVKLIIFLITVATTQPHSKTPTQTHIRALEDKSCSINPNFRRSYYNAAWHK